MPEFKTSDVDPKNRENMKRLENGGTTEYWQAAGVVAIGPNHKPEVMKALKTQGTSGKLTITKGLLLDPGKVEVTNCHDRHEFEQTIKRISKKKVVFK
jgi:hypothetical protein